MKHTLFAIKLLFLLSFSTTCLAEDLQDYLNKYFKGSAIQYGYGSGISSNSPRVELFIHYCASGKFFSSGKTCRPNIIAKGYQCSQLQDAGQWQIAVQSGNAFIQWMSYNNGPGSLPIFISNNGLVVDAKGNSFTRTGNAQCN